MGSVGALGATLFGGIELLKFMFPAATLESPPQFKTGFTVSDLTGNGTLKVNVISRHRQPGHRGPRHHGDLRGLPGVHPPRLHAQLRQRRDQRHRGHRHLATTVARHYTAEGGAISTRNGWACPCHGSRYYIDSTNFYGPAPRPMDWVDIQISPDNHFVVNRAAITVYRQAGDTTVPKWRLDPKTGKSNGQTVGV